MSNTFKSTSRFAGLIDDPTTSTSVKIMKKMGWKEGSGLGKTQDGIKTTLQVEKREHNIGIGFRRDENNFNSFKATGFRERRQNRNLSEREVQQLREEYKVESEAKMKIEKQDKERRNHETLQIDNFPVLVLQNNEHNQTFEETYIEKLKSICEVESINSDPDLEKLNDGWIIIKKDVLTGKIITKGKMTTPGHFQFTEHELSQHTIDKLGELHERRTHEYIELNGYDKWENTFKCHNWREWESQYEIETDDEYDNSSDDDMVCYEEY